MIHVTDHARERWHKRASIGGNENVHDIIDAVKKSKFIKKNQPLPFGLPRLPGTVYSLNNGVVFVMEAMTIDEFRLVTVITEDEKAVIKKATGPPKRRLALRQKRLIRKSLDKKREIFKDESGTNHKNRTSRKERRKKAPSCEEIDGFDSSP